MWASCREIGPSFCNRHPSGSSVIAHPRFLSPLSELTAGSTKSAFLGPRSCSAQWIFLRKTLSESEPFLMHRLSEIRFVLTVLRARICRVGRFYSCLRLVTLLVARPIEAHPSLSLRCARALSSRSAKAVSWSSNFWVSIVGCASFHFIQCRYPE